MTQVTILSGSVVRIWGTLENILERNEGSLSKSDRMMRVVRVELEAGKHLVGKKADSMSLLGKFISEDA